MPRAIFASACALPLVALAACATTATYTSAARRHAAAEFGCTPAEVEAKEIGETDAGKKYEATGCGKHATYVVACPTGTPDPDCKVEPVK